MANRKETIDELSIDEFEKLATEKPAVSASKNELMDMLDGVAVRTGAVAKKLGVTHSTIYARLTRLEENGLIEKRYQEKTAYWTLSDVGRTELENAGTEAEEEEDETNE